ncbi:MAG: HAD family hydrolase [Gaiellaceae bacterium]
MTPAELDAVTLDAFGTLVELDDHIGRLGAALRAAGVERDAAAIGDAFEHEVRHYAAHKCDARDEASLGALRRECADVFVRQLGVELEFADAFVAAIAFRPLPGVLDAIAALRGHGLALAVVSNWDCSLPGHLERAGIRVDAVVTCAEAGAAKPDPAIFRVALERLGVAPGRALHVGDQPEDEAGARTAGLRFAPAPLPEVVAAWT